MTADAARRRLVALEPIPGRRSLADEAADRLRELILLEELEPGAPISERELAEALGISRTPLRDAMRLLEIDGLLEYTATRPARCRRRRRRAPDLRGDRADRQHAAPVRPRSPPDLGGGPEPACRRPRQFRAGGDRRHPSRGREDGRAADRRRWTLALGHGVPQGHRRRDRCRRDDVPRSGPDRPEAARLRGGVTVQGGMPFPGTTPAHGTAFDIAGQGRADVSATRAAFRLACNMVVNWT
ncbi:hypothetical protein BH23PSE1_BH23PSE1_07720 [soil metagenome]